MMNQYMMRVEAVNLSTFILDTNDLSTIRGAGLLLLDAVKEIRVPGLRAIYAGGSVGLFEFSAVDDDAAEIKRIEVEEQVHGGARAHATFVVDWERSGADFPTIHARLVAKSRWRQMRSVSSVTPAAGTGGSVCAVDDTRPGVEARYRKGASDSEENRKKTLLSTATAKRRDHGIDQKHRFYSDRFPTLDPNQQFVNDFDQLTESSSHGLLAGKMAVVYLDGNQFGATTRACRSPEKLSAWSKLITGKQEAFLQSVLATALRERGEKWLWSGDVVTNEGHRIRKRDALRIETLQWGGDELVFVVPAWLAWWFLGEFFRGYGDGTRSFDPGTGKSITMTHGAGLVFCHHKAPIKRVQDLARHLAEAPKEVAADRFAYQTLESFDHLGTEFDRSRCGRWKVNHPRELVLDGAKMRLVPAEMEKFRTSFPRNQLHTIVQDLVNGRHAAGIERGDQALELAGMTDVFASLTDLLAGLSSDRKKICWLHLAELWDYTRVG